MADGPVTLDLIYRVAAMLDRAAIEHAFIGGVALNAWAVPRSTFDLDVAIAADDQKLTALLARADADGCIVDHHFQEGYRDHLAGLEKVHFLLPVGASALAVDLFLASVPFLVALLERRRSIELGRGPLPVATAADLLLLKLLAHRSKDQADLENLLAVQGVPEPEYLRHWADRLSLTERLETLLRSGRPRGG